MVTKITTESEMLNFIEENVFFCTGNCSAIEHKLIKNMKQKGLIMSLKDKGINYFSNEEYYYVKSNDNIYIEVINSTHYIKRN